MKHVFGSHSECMHVYANKRFDGDYGNASNLSFRGSIAMSYNHYEIGHIVDYDKRRILIQVDRYNMATSRHISELLRATRHYDSIAVPFLGNAIDHIKNVKYFKRQYETFTKKKCIYNNHVKTAKEYYDKAVKYTQWFSIKTKLSNELQKWLNDCAKTDYDRIIADIDEKINARNEAYSLPENIKKREIDRQKRIEAKRAKREIEFTELRLRYEADISDWKANKINRLYYGYNDMKYKGKIYLRLSKDKKRIETNLNAQVLTEHVKRLWLYCLKSYIHKAKYTYDNVKIDYYNLSCIENGNVTIGCHYIEFDEIRYIAERLGLIEMNTIIEQLTEVNT